MSNFTKVFLLPILLGYKLDFPLQNSYEQKFHSTKPHTLIWANFSPNLWMLNVALALRPLSSIGTLRKSIFNWLIRYLPGSIGHRSGNVLLAINLRYNGISFFTKKHRSVSILSLNFESGSLADTFRETYVKTKNKLTQLIIKRKTKCVLWKNAPLFHRWFSRAQLQFQTPTALFRWHARTWDHLILLNLVMIRHFQRSIRVAGIHDMPQIPLR